MGEVLRSAYAKHLVHKHRGRLQVTCLKMHQWGVGMPGSAEALSHWRCTIEELIRDGTIEPMLATDLDLVNMFGSVEWPAIRVALGEHLPEALPWATWQHQQPCTTLPSGTTWRTNKGAEQGDVLGSAQSVLSLGRARAASFVASGPNQAAYTGACDEWYID